MFIDSHSHLHDPEFFTKKQAEKILLRAREKSVKKIVCIGTSHEDSIAAKNFAKAHEDVFWTYGIHPENANKLDFKYNHVSAKEIILDSDEHTIKSASEESISELSAVINKNVIDKSISDLSKNIINGSILNPIKIASKNADKTASSNLSKAISKNLVAVGEVGLDYHYEGYDREAQIKLFNEMLQLASDYNLPVSFHIREAFPDFFPVVANFPKIRGVVHSFSDNKKNLKKILETTDFYVGVNGMATYSTLPTPPLSRILLETDAPFLTPKPFRGIINESGYIPVIAEWLAGKLNISLEEVAKETTENAEKLFKFTRYKEADFDRF